MTATVNGIIVLALGFEESKEAATKEAETKEAEAAPALPAVIADTKSAV
jgi:hypothetical protein